MATVTKTVSDPFNASSNSSSALAQQVFVARQAEAKATRDLEVAQLQNAQRQQELAIQRDLEALKLQDQQRNADRAQLELDIRAQQANAVINALQLRTQADTVVFDAQQDRLLTLNDIEVGRTQQAAQSAQAQRQQQLRQGQVGTQAATSRASEAGRGGTSSQGQATRTGALAGAAQEGAELTNQTTAATSAGKRQGALFNNLLNIQDKLARVDASRLLAQADFTERAANISANASQSNVSQSSNAARSSTRAAEQALKQEQALAQDNYASVLAQVNQRYNLSQSELRMLQQGVL